MGKSLFLIAAISRVLAIFTKIVEQTTKHCFNVTFLGIRLNDYFILFNQEIFSHIRKKPALFR